MRALERFNALGLRLAGFTHQIKTPLHVIQSQAELLIADPTLPAAARKSLELIFQNAEKAAQQTKSVLDMARGKNQGWEVKPMEPLLEEMCASAQSECRQRGITLEIQREAGLLSPVRMDAVVLEGALHNLLSNAIEATPKGGQLHVRLFETSDGKRIAVQISDTGKGMNAKRLARIQQPFQTDKAEGTGLGLFITRHIMRRHGARMAWESTPGKGTRVTITFAKARALTPTTKVPVTLALAGGTPPVITIDRRDGSGPATRRDDAKRMASYGLWQRLARAFAAAILLIGPLAAARMPQLLRLQGRFTDSKIPLTDNLPVRFSIWDTNDGYGNLLWEDVQTVSVQNDQFQVVLGRSKPLTPSVFSGGDRWVELQVGSDAPMRPRHRIPYQYIQAQVAAVQVIPIVEPPAPPPPAVYVPPPPPVPPPAPAIDPQEQQDLEIQMDKYKEPVKEPVRKPIPAPKRKHVIQAPEGSGLQGPVYEVQPGDTLKSIAGKLYGNAELWYDLYYLNRDRLGPMGHLFTGQLLVLPSHQTGEAAR